MMGAASGETARNSRDRLMTPAPARTKINPGRPKGTTKRSLSRSVMAWVHDGCSRQTCPNHENIATRPTSTPRRTSDFSSAAPAAMSPRASAANTGQLLGAGTSVASAGRASATSSGPIVSASRGTKAKAASARANAANPAITRLVNPTRSLVPTT